MNFSNIGSALPVTSEPIQSSDEGKPTESPSTVASASLYSSDGSSSQVSIKNVPTTPIVKGILKKTSAYTAMRRSGKVPTTKPTRSISFAENSTAADGEKKPTTMAPIKVVAPNHSPKSTTSSRGSRTAPPAYLPDEYVSDPALEKAVADARKFISGNLRKAASAVANFARRPEDFLFPEQQPQQKQPPKSASSKSGK
ncbi:MAG: hypothetical protein FJ390_07365 [Verrucomicrobia bacterium]|nr:hypothetical protein [Verrucomicrobiota bacterium]